MAKLERENQRLMAQVAEMSGGRHLELEAAQWRDLSPAERLAALVQLCRGVPQLRELWPADVAARADVAEPMPADTEQILLNMRRSSSGS